MRRGTRAAGITSTVALLLGAFGAHPAQADGTAAHTAAEGGQDISVSTDAARYAPGEPVTITVDVVNDSPVAVKGHRISLSVSHLGAPAAPVKKTTVSLAPGASTERTFTWRPPAKDFRGYLVRADITDRRGEIVDSGYTAVDVSSDASRFPRYGFVSSFDSGVDTTRVADYLKDHHINAVQYYDWNWKHHIPLAGTPSAPADSWTDMANRTNERQTVLDLIDKGHDRGADAYSYNLVFGADNGYGEDGSGVDPRWGMFKNPDCTGQDGHPLPSSWAINHIYLMDPANTAWQDHLMDREKDVYAAYPFDGWQADQLGNRGDLYTCDGRKIDLSERYEPMLDAFGDRLDKKLVFNAVGQYAQQKVADNPHLEFLYTEAWPWDGQATYADLQQVIHDNHRWSGGKNTVLAAYVNNALGEAPGRFNAPGVLTADAVIFASGGAHIELGDVDHMLSNPYYPNSNLALDDDLKESLTHYYDFLVAYQNLLRDGARPNSNTIAMPGTPTSTNGSGDSVWTFAKTKGDTDVLHFINLLGNSDTSWVDTNGTRKAPPVQTDRTVKYYYQGSERPTAVHLASPDSDGGASQVLPFTRGSDSGGDYVQFTLPRLAYWDMVWITKGDPKAVPGTPVDPYPGGGAGPAALAPGGPSARRD